jgi:hypothetical protein
VADDESVMKANTNVDMLEKQVTESHLQETRWEKTSQ